MQQQLTETNQNAIEECEIMNSIYPSSVKEIRPNEFLLTIPISSSETEVTLLPSSLDVPRRYMNKQTVVINDLPDVQVLVSYVNLRPVFQIQGIWLSLQNLIDITTSVEEQFSQYDSSGLFLALYTTITDFPHDHLVIQNLPPFPIPISEKQKVILEHAVLSEKSIFESQNSVSCPVCYEDLPPSDFVQISNCGDRICKKCMIDGLNMAVNTGSHLLCPFTNCRAEILSWELRGICDPELVLKYEKQLTLLFVQKGGESLSCPFCKSGGILVDKEVFTHPTPIKCPICQSVFCSVCLQGNHVGSCYGKDTKKEEKEDKEEIHQNVDRPWFNAKYFRSQKYRKIVQESIEFGGIKKCPRCRAPVLKSYGCNKITCICGAYFCYLCGKEISGYNHFGNGCPLFTENSLREDSFIQVDFNKKDLNKYFKNKDEFPFVCQCGNVVITGINSLVIVCNKCNTVRCRHCTTLNPSREHLKSALKEEDFIGYYVSHDVWKITNKTQDTEI
ncbi:ariadne RING finger, putative [Entamoeba invadens IP1]|uniref:Ariadne RING finger, putative n=1 Tax=Entamoeba invadens IP1 TaxID=370355 RepID=A0A0A1U665_ENTIV|nr:ariadne RING finger, putative [Entamoeba invadens IP1]ELP89820.1 ariadne RING finger, putative [Entamoeba invadens IP1]|eukprot:XP_004256591.1 ariadne RING finger, putative [Entamoeba invadens IP1]